MTPKQLHEFTRAFNQAWDRVPLYDRPYAYPTIRRIAAYYGMRET